MSTADRPRLALQVLWNLRALSLFLIGPVIGVVLSAVIFGMPRALQVAACVMFLFSLGIYALLVRGEWRRLSAGRGASVRWTLAE